MKHCLIVILLLSAVFSLTAQQDKRVYITLDVSGSMTGNKYALANYTTQMIVTLCDDDDEVYLIVYGKAERLSGKHSPLSIIQKPMGYLKFGIPTSFDSQFDDIIGFNEVYKESNNKQNWLFIIGDGEWDTMNNYYTDGRNKFSNIVKKGKLNVCYLQTGHSLSAPNSDFTQFVKTLGVVDIKRSDINPQTIKEGCDYFARKILGFSEEPLKVTKTGPNCISIKTEMPLKEFYLVYQDRMRPSDLPKVDEVNANGQTLHAVLKGTPTTQPLKTVENEVDLSGHVYWVKGKNKIPTNKEITVCFDKGIDLANVSIYPLLEEIGEGLFTVNVVSEKLKRLDSHTYAICQEDSKAQVRIELSEESAQSLPESLLKKTKVVVKANNKEYTTKFKNGGFECKIDLMGDTTQYYTEIDCPGYFKRVTPINTIIRDCESVEKADMPVRVLPVANAGSITINQLKSDNIVFSISDAETKEALDPNLFDITFEVENDFLFEQPKMHIEDDSLIVLELRPKGDWCDCMFPESLNFKMISTPKEGAFEETGKSYQQTVLPVHIDLKKEGSWLSRCLWVILTMIALALLFLYLRALQRKRRFKKNAKIIPTYYDYYGNKIDAGSIYLRKDGFGAWFARWFLPSDERCTLSFDKPTTSLRFLAAESYDVVNIPKEGNIDPLTMKISGYDSKKDQRPKEPVKLGNNGKIIMKTSDGNDEGYLLFNSGNSVDGAGYRILLIILKTATVFAFMFLLYLVIRSLF